MKMGRKLLGFTGDSHVAKGNQARDDRRWGDAVSAYALHLKDAPNDYAILVQMGNCAKEAQEFATSLDSYFLAANINSKDADLHLQMGHLYKLMGRTRHAAKSYARALQINDGLVDARRELSEIQHDTGGDDFSLPDNMLDFIKSANIHELLSKARNLGHRGDPFEVYSDLIN